MQIETMLLTQKDVNLVANIIKILNNFLSPRMPFTLSHSPLEEHLEMLSIFIKNYFLTIK